MTMDTYVAFDFLPPIKPGKFGPCYEVRTYVFKTDGLAPTVELWRKAVPGRMTVSPLLTAMTSVTGTVIALHAHLALYEPLMSGPDCERRRSRTGFGRRPADPAISSVSRAISICRRRFHRCVDRIFEMHCRRRYRRQQFC